jgi:hypothetical protein
MRQPGHKLSTQTTLTCLKSVRVRALLLVYLMLGRVSVASVQAAAPDNELPPSRIDPNLPPQIVLNADQGLGTILHFVSKCAIITNCV